MKKVKVFKKNFYGSIFTQELTVIREDEKFVFVQENCPGSVLHSSLVALPKNGQSVKVGVSSKYSIWNL
jgi:hypothetical protein